MTLRCARICIAVLAVAMAVTPERAAGRAAQNPALALVGGSLIDGTGNPPVRNSVVLIRNDRIEAVGTVESLPVPNGYETVSTEGMTVLPGLWDLHVHLMYAGHPDFVARFDSLAPGFCAWLVAAMKAHAERATETS